MKHIRLRRLQRFGQDPVRPHRKPLHLRSQPFVHQQDLIIAGIFHGIDAVVPQKDQDLAVQILRARPDDDLVGLYVHTAETPQMAGDRPAEFGKPLRGSAQSQCLRALGKHLPYDPLQLSERR